MSSAGAIGWMQFLPSTWRRYGVDASGSGLRDPYNAADAIFAAARYLAAAGGTHNLPRAIFAYNHSHAYVESVMLRAELLSGEPSALVDSVSQLAEGDFPIQLGDRAPATVRRHARTPRVPRPSPAPTGTRRGRRRNRGAKSPATDIFAASGAAAVAVQDGTIVAIGRNRQLGRYVVLRSAFGDRFTYGNLASVSAWYPTPKAPRRSAALLSTSAPAALAPGPRPTAPATAGAQSSSTGPSAALFRRERAAAAAAAAQSTPIVATINLRSRPTVATLFTPLVVLERAVRHATVERSRRSLLARYFTGAFGLRASQLGLERLRVGSHVLAGTILGRLAHTSGTHRPHLIFKLRPAGTAETAINAGRSSTHGRNSGRSSCVATASTRLSTVPTCTPQASVPCCWPASWTWSGSMLPRTPAVTLPACERAAVAAGSVDRRVLAALEVLVLHGLDPTVSGAWCSAPGRTGRRSRRS